MNIDKETIWDFVIPNYTPEHTEQKVLEPLIPKERLRGAYDSYKAMLEAINDDSEFDKNYTAVMWASGDFPFHVSSEHLTDEMTIFSEIDKAVKHLKRLLNDALGNENTESVWVEDNTETNV